MRPGIGPQARRLRRRSELRSLKPSFGRFGLRPSRPAVSANPKSSPARSRAGELSRLFRRLILHAQRPDPVRPIVGVAFVGTFI